MVLAQYLLGDFSGQSLGWEMIDKEENYFCYEINAVSVLLKKKKKTKLSPITTVLLSITMNDSITFTWLNLWHMYFVFY